MRQEDGGFVWGYDKSQLILWAFGESAGEVEEPSVRICSDDSKGC